MLLVEVGGLQVPELHKSQIEWKIAGGRPLIVVAASMTHHLHLNIRALKQRAGSFIVHRVVLLHAVAVPRDARRGSLLYILTIFLRTLLAVENWRAVMPRVRRRPDTLPRPRIPDSADAPLRAALPSLPSLPPPRLPPRFPGRAASPVPRRLMAPPHQYSSSS